jgi:integrase/recombinase XerC
MSAPTSHEILEAYLDWLRDVKRAQPITVYQYEGKLRDFLEFVGPMRLCDVSTQTIEVWLQRPRGGRARGQMAAPATMQRDAIIVGNLFKFAIARGWLTHDPTALLVTPAVHNKNPDPVPDELWVPTWSREKLPDEARVVLGLGYFCGLRREEIVKLRGANVDLRGSRLVAFPRKGGGDDVLHFGECLGALADGVDVGDVPDLIVDQDLFLGPLSRLARAAGRGPLLRDWPVTPEGTPNPHRIYRKFAAWGFDFRPHQTRHSFVTNLLRVGVPLPLVSTLANHSSVQTTMRYAKLGGQDLREFRRRKRRNRWDSDGQV